MQHHLIEISEVLVNVQNTLFGVSAERLPSIYHIGVGPEDQDLGDGLRLSESDSEH